MGEPITVGEYVAKLEELVAAHPNAAVADPAGRRLDLLAVEALEQTREAARFTPADQVMEEGGGLPYVRDVVPEDLPRVVGSSTVEAEMALGAAIEALPDRARWLLAPTKILVTG